MTTTKDKGPAFAVPALQNTTVDDGDYPMSALGSKAFATLAAQFAIAGHSLHRTDPKDGPARAYVTRWGMVRTLDTLDDARRFLRAIGGDHG